MFPKEREPDFFWRERLSSRSPFVVLCTAYEIIGCHVFAWWHFVGALSHRLFPAHVHHLHHVCSKFWAEIGSESKLQTAMPLGAWTLQLIETMKGLDECRLCMSCAFEYVRKYISENLGSTEINFIPFAVFIVCASTCPRQQGNDVIFLDVFHVRCHSFSF